MEIVIDIESDVPMFTQLIEQIKAAIESNAIAPGDPLPSIRQLANELDINNKTVAKAYRLLERDAIIQAKGYRGSFVHPDAVENCQKDHSEAVSQILASVIQELRAMGTTDSEIRIAFNEQINAKDVKGK